MSWETEVAELLANPRGWPRRQTEKHLEAPLERTLTALCTAVAYEIFNDPHRGEEVRPAVERALEAWQSA